MRNLFIEEARILGLLAFFTIAEWVAGKAYNKYKYNKCLCLHIKVTQKNLLPCQWGLEYADSIS